jgi:hypothetical protein
LSGSDSLATWAGAPVVTTVEPPAVRISLLLPALVASPTPGILAERFTGAPTG